MNTVKLCYIIVLATLISSCNTGADSKKSKKINYADNPAFKDAIIKNDIELEGSGVKLKEAYLMDKDEKRMVTNEVKVGDYIYLVLQVDTGWTKIDGKSFIGASEKILTARGRTVVEAEDIFKDSEETGFSAEDASYIRLSAVITQADNGVNKFEVHFRVWDKKGPGELKGTYNFRLKD
ncbi:MAG TPA: hypothetical protein VHL77_06450 [Ferruginibacter sp.]|jgi:hypothetical protein|nr:hypothetical protein [Ferruginibacter sp.]